MITTILGPREREAIGARTRAALQHKKARGEKLGGDVPYGYRCVDGRLVEHQGEQALLELLHQLSANGMGQRRIAVELTQRGFRTRKNTAFHWTQIGRLLRRGEGRMALGYKTGGRRKGTPNKATVVRELLMQQWLGEKGVTMQPRHVLEAMSAIVAAGSLPTYTNILKRVPGSRRDLTRILRGLRRGEIEPVNLEELPPWMCRESTAEDTAPAAGRGGYQRFNPAEYMGSAPDTGLQQVLPLDTLGEECRALEVRRDALLREVESLQQEREDLKAELLQMLVEG